MGRSADPKTSTPWVRTCPRCGCELRKGDGEDDHFNCPCCGWSDRPEEVRADGQIGRQAVGR